MVLTNAERQARFRAKRNADAERKAAYLQKEKQRYKACLETGKKKLIADMTPREQRKQEWRSRYHSSQKIKKAASSSVQPSPSTALGVSRQKLSALQKKADENALLKEQLAALHRQLSASQTRVKTLEKRAERSAKKPPTTPRSKTKALLQAENFKVTKASKVRKTLEFHHALVNEIQSSETADGSKHKFLSTLLAFLFVIICLS
ncbi:hypothetical protein RRG08_006054 [Elysia crispata]|uniref:Uncharacterized protein n=1 Tax=Elysia crispata TaxID=231223 RepID=A0AAE0Z478_9GAST|nr:hypothetical protein RRG08_006054 [Elysia crispata]